jgi:uncharacterized LabA/DUF88 family protein
MPQDAPPAHPPQPPSSSRPRAAFFVDGANLYHRYQEGFGFDTNTLDLRKLAKSLAGATRDVTEIRYYTGKVQGKDSAAMLAQQQSLLVALQRQGVHIRLGRLESRSKPNELAEQILQFLAVQRPASERLPPTIYRALHALTSAHREITYLVQKAVDTLLVSDLARMAADNLYDVAYVLSQDGDMTPGIEFARSRGKTVFGAGPPGGRNFQLKQVCNSYIVMDLARLNTCLIDRT